MEEKNFASAGLQELTKEYNITIKVPQKAAEGEEPKSKFLTFQLSSSLILRFHYIDG